MGRKHKGELCSVGRSLPTRKGRVEGGEEISKGELFEKGRMGKGVTYRGGEVCAYGCTIRAKGIKAKTSGGTRSNGDIRGETLEEKV